MKITIEYGDDDMHEARLAMRASELAAGIDDVYNYIRGILKHSDPSDEVEAHLEHIRAMLPSTEV